MMLMWVSNPQVQYEYRLWQVKKLDGHKSCKYRQQSSVVSSSLFIHGVDSNSPHKTLWTQNYRPGVLCSEV